jgi:hypothetical protein
MAKILNLLTRALKARINRAPSKNNPKASSKKKRQKIPIQRSKWAKITTSMKTASAVHQTIRMLKTIPEKV